MNKIKEILKSQRGQGVWEYMVVLVGIGLVAYLVTDALKEGLTEDKGIVDNVTGSIGDLIEKAAGETAGEPVNP